MRRMLLSITATVTCPLRDRGKGCISSYICGRLFQAANVLIGKDDLPAFTKVCEKIVKAIKRKRRIAERKGRLELAAEPLREYKHN